MANIAHVTFDIRERFDSLLERVVLDGDDVIDMSRLAMPRSQRQVAPYLRTARECGLGDRPWREVCPEWLVRQITDEQVFIVDALRHPWKQKWDPPLTTGYDDREMKFSTLAEMVLVLAERSGFYLGETWVYPRFKFIATKTGRFGVESGSVNPMVFTPQERATVRRRRGRRIASLDFRAMDLCSILALFPQMRRFYVDTDFGDLHMRTTEYLGMTAAMRDEVKRETFVYAYGGRSQFHNMIEHFMPEFAQVRATPGVPLLVQERSATTFRWALGNALPEMVEGEVMPLFPVHDELVVEYRDEGALMTVVDAMLAGAHLATGVRHWIEVKEIGDNG